MAIRGGPLRSSSGASTVPGWRVEDFHRSLTFFHTEGVVQGSGGELAVTERAAGANMSVDVATGFALIEITTTLLSPNATLKTWLENDDVVNVSVPTADSTHPRIDRIVAKFDMTVDPNGAASNNVSIELVQGTPAASPSAPAEPSNTITLATISVPASDTSIEDAQITDTRELVALDNVVLKRLQLFESSELTIASGAITVTGPVHTVDTESDAASDELDTINPALGNGEMILIFPQDAARTVVIKHATGNIRTADGNDFDLDGTDKSILLYKDGSNWKEVSRSGSLTTVLTVSDETADRELENADQGKVLTNSGTTVPVILRLPAVVEGLHFQFVAADTDGIAVRIDDSLTEFFSDGDTEVIGLVSISPYSLIEVIAINATRWIIGKKFGTWTQMFRAGYCAGGREAGPTNVNDIEKLTYPTEAISSLSATLSSNRFAACGVSGQIAGYFLGGNDGSNVSTIGKLRFPYETEENIAATLDTASTFNQGGVQSATKGYVAMHNVAPGDDIEDINFSNDTSAVLAAVLPANRSEGTATTKEGERGYFYGGDSGGGAQDDIYYLLFSNETTGTGANVLPANTISATGNVQNGTTAGYIAGNGIYSNVIRKLTYSGETTSTLAATLDTALRGAAGVTRAGVKGFWLGGETGAFTSQINDLTFSGEASVAIAATLSAARGFIGTGVMNSSY